MRQRDRKAGLDRDQRRQWYRETKHKGLDTYGKETLKQQK
jgi:hypothetical protein